MLNSKIVVIGGGTGTYNVLTGLKHLVSDLTVVVSMADSGGSAKKERDEFGLLPVSDVRKSLIALAEEEKDSELMRSLFNFRFDEGVGITGMTFGNLFLVALSQVLGSQTKAIEEAGRILKIRGRVLPVSNERTNLVAEYENGLSVVGENEIDEPKHDGKLKIKKIYLLPAVKVSPEVLDAISAAGLIILGPGDLYTTILPNLVVSGLAKAITRSRAKKVYICNLMTKYGQTYGFTAAGHVKTLESYLGGCKLDKVIYNSTSLPRPLLKRYENEYDFPVADDLPRNKSIIRGDFLAKRIIRRQKGDRLKRSFIRHDPEKLAAAIISLI